MSLSKLGILVATAGLVAGTAQADIANGGYVGGQLGNLDADTSLPNVDGNDMAYGLFAGYNYALDQAIIGGELEYDWADVDLSGAATIESVFRAKLRAGALIGGGLLYGTAGYAQADTDTLGSSDGYFIGFGYDYAVTDQISVGAEYLYHSFDDFNGTGIDVDANTIKLRAAYNF